MSAKRDREPPDEWADKVTHTEGDGPEVEEKGELGQSYQVKDRRHWAEGVDEEETEPVVDKPSYVKALEDELQKKDETLKEYIVCKNSQMCL